MDGEMWKLLQRFIALRTVSADPAADNEFAHAENFLTAALASLGFSVQTFPTAEHHPILLGTRGSANAPTALLIYGHYDVQPANCDGQWSSDPFFLVERDGKLYGRGVADDKGPIAAILSALRSAGDLPNLRITFVLEGSEEIGSPSFLDFLKTNHGNMRADAAIVLDTGCPEELRPAITTSLRGILPFEVCLTTGERDLHSGFGGCVPNAIQELLRLCSRLHGPDGRVAVPGFYDGISLAGCDCVSVATGEDEQFAKEMGVRNLQCLFPQLPRHAVHGVLPSLDFNGIWSGYQGLGSKTIIPAVASAKFTVRTVAGQDQSAMGHAVEQFLKSHAPAHCQLSVKMSTAAPAYGLDWKRLDGKFIQLFSSLESAVEAAFGTKPVHRREGGSIGVVSAFWDVLGLDSMLLGVVPPESRIHASDENWSMESFWRTQLALEYFFKNIDQEH
ncbi:MAG: M20/M25/M40 family metallo-hydrolase [Puniceicoccales bacterium]|nr:M20/M25/M40 family metallo-hydrolase [Puniceicoccales bacterium]